MNNGGELVLKNTIFLYIRMIILTLISLFSVRIVLHVLGDADYGLYNVVAGFVSLFSFVSGTLAVASQRYFAVSLASNDWDDLNRYFSLNLKIYALFIIIATVLAETVGLWFVMNQLTIEDGRMTAAIIVYEFSIVTFAMSLVSSPFQALLIADENLGIYSWISIFEGIAKIVVVYLLYISPIDKLVAYGFLLMVVSILVNVLYALYTKKKYKKLKYSKVNDKGEMKTVLSYMNWNLIGAVGSVGKGQGINIVINMFFSSTVNAARAIGLQINTVVSSFSSNFMKAVDPQITKKYALGDEEGLNRLINTSAKMSYYLLYIICLPLIFNIGYVLELWLGNDVPNYTEQFAVLALIDAMALAFTDPLGKAVQATGKVKTYQLTVGICALMNVPTAYIALLIVKDPLLPAICSIVLSTFMAIGRIIIYKKLNNSFAIRSYLKNVIIPITITTIITVFFSILIVQPYTEFWMFILYVIVIVAFTTLVIFFLGISKLERQLLLSFVKKILKKGRNYE
jgi:O-antigen/teichoic acid export membrane protein